MDQTVQACFQFKGIHHEHVIECQLPGSMGCLEATDEGHTLPEEMRGGGGEGSGMGGVYSTVIQTAV